MRRAGTATALAAADLVAVTAAAVIIQAAGWPVASYAGAVLVLAAATGQYRPRICLRVAEDAGRISAAAVMGLPVLLPWLPGRQALVLALTCAGLLFAARGATFGVVRAARRRGRLPQRALLVGGGQTGTHLAYLLRQHPELGLRAVGFLDSPSAAAAAGAPAILPSPLPWLGRPAELGRVVREHGIGQVIVASPDSPDEDLAGVLRAARSLPAGVCMVPRLAGVGLAVPRACLDEIWGVPLLVLRRPNRAGLAAKRVFDLAVSLPLLAVAGLPVLVAGLAMRWQLRRPALFRQVRVTRSDRLTEIIKLRTLRGHRDPDTCWTAPPEQSTRLGRLLRATHADELPQLVNVVRGQMSLVGPRPERPYFARRFAAEIPGYRDRHRMTAGLTGWAQVNGLTGDTPIADRAVFDNAYIDNWSFWLDLVILARTAGMALSGLAGRSPQPGRARLPGGAPTGLVPVSTRGG